MIQQAFFMKNLGLLGGALLILPVDRADLVAFLVPVTLAMHAFWAVLNDLPHADFQDCSFAMQGSRS